MAKKAKEKTFERSEPNFTYLNFEIDFGTGL
jgi:hypothetical protein